MRTRKTMVKNHTIWSTLRARSAATLYPHHYPPNSATSRHPSSSSRQRLEAEAFWRKRSDLWSAQPLSLNTDLTIISERECFNPQYTLLPIYLKMNQTSVQSLLYDWLTDIRLTTFNFFTLTRGHPCSLRTPTPTSPSSLVQHRRDAVERGRVQGCPLILVQGWERSDSAWVNPT